MLPNRIMVRFSVAVEGVPWWNTTEITPNNRSHIRDKGQGKQKEIQRARDRGTRTQRTGLDGRDLVKDASG